MHLKYHAFIFMLFFSCVLNDSSGLYPVKSLFQMVSLSEYNPTVSKSWILL